MSVAWPRWKETILDEPSLSSVRQSDEEWNPIEDAPDDLTEGLFAYPDSICGYQQMVIYGFVSVQRTISSTIYDHRGVRPEIEEPFSMSAKALALAGGATYWRPVPPAPTPGRHGNVGGSGFDFNLASPCKPSSCGRKCQGLRACGK
jgi:hypothetical protein